MKKRLAQGLKQFRGSCGRSSRRTGLGRSCCRSLIGSKINKFFEKFLNFFGNFQTLAIVEPLMAAHFTTSIVFYFAQ